MRGRKTGGRRKGTPNKVTAEARAVCAAILDDPTYRTNLTRRARAGTLAPAVEAMLWHYAFGKPRNSLDVTVGPAGDLSELSTEDLLHRVDGLREQVREQAARERALPASRMAGGAREHAVHGRDTVAGPMTPAQLAEAQRLAREWDAAHPRER